MMDLSIIQHKALRAALAQGLNHIPLKPMYIASALVVIMDAYEHLCNILSLAQNGFSIEATRKKLHGTCLNTLKAAMKSNKSGFCFFGRFLSDIQLVQNEVEWLLQHLYCSGLDKAANNACFIGIKHIRLQALEQFTSLDFAPCKSNSL